jgi:hypothetical protein
MLNCARSHALTPDNIYTRPGGKVRECRACQRLSRQKAAKSVEIGEKVIRRVMLALDEGLTLNRIAGLGGPVGKRYVGGKIVDIARLRLFCEAKPRLGKIIRAKAEANRIAIKIITNQSRHPTIASPAIIRATDDIMDEIQAAVPLYLQEDLRDDAIQNIWLDVLRGRLKHRDIAARAMSYVKSEYKTNHNAWGPRSLDVPIWIDGKTTLLDTLTRGLWD